MGALLRAQAPSQVDHDERSETQLHEGGRTRKCGQTDFSELEVLVEKQWEMAEYGHDHFIL
jgi:hypothetical protein